MKFLSAEWKHLLLANYHVDAKVLQPYLPVGTQIDSFDGNVFVSLVAFLFDRTRVLGIPIPFHRRFEEVNLRFYVTPEKDRSIRAVTFIKEIVPKSMIPIIANNFFSENYVAQTMDHGIEDGQAGDRHWYSWENGTRNVFAGTVGSERTHPDPRSIAEFITEHYWGYSKGVKQTLEYQVEHPQWKCCDVSDFQIDVDFGATYGKDFSFLNSLQPHSVQYAEGSAVTVSFPHRL